MKQLYFYSHGVRCAAWHLPAATDARVHRGTWTIPPLFSFLQKSGQVSDDEMFRAFNMGIGMVVVVGSAHMDVALGMLRDAGEEPKVIGEIVAGEKRVLL